MNKLVFVFSLLIFAALGSSAQNIPRGTIMGGCYQQKNADFSVSYGGFAAYPIVSCPGSGSPGIPQCAPGFTLIILSQSQANTSDGSSVMDSIRRLAEELFTKETYFTAWACAKQ